MLPLLAQLPRPPLRPPLHAAPHAALASLSGAPSRMASADSGCAWWNFACKGGHAVANAGLSAITQSIASGGEMLLGQIVKVIDSQSAVPLADPTYRHVYYGFLGLAAPLVGIVLCGALVLACLRRDAGTLVRAVVGVGVAGLGGAFYIVLAQLLVAVDDWLAHGVVRVTGHSLTSSITQLAAGFHHVAGTSGEVAANMLLIVLMGLMLISGLILWFVLVLRKVAILVVVAFAPLLIVGYLWAPTRTWVRRATEVLVALVFTKTAIFTLFGIGLALLSRGTHQSLADFVGSVVLMCGACFAPMVMLRLVHFAADSHLAGDAIGTLHGGLAPVTRRLPGGLGGPGGLPGGGRAAGSQPAMGRHDLADTHGQAPTPGPTQVDPSLGTGPASNGAGTGGAAAAEGGAVAGAAGAASGGLLLAGQTGASKARQAGGAAIGTARQFGEGVGQDSGRGFDFGGARHAGPDPGSDPADRPLAGPTPPDPHNKEGGNS